MPQYRTVTPTFTPISLQEYLAVPTTIIGEYAKAEDKFEEYQDKASQLEALVGEDPYGRSIIDKYRNVVQSASDAIGNNGIQNAEAYRQALGARRYYRENLMPLEVGIPYWEQYKKTKLSLGEDPLEESLNLEDFVKNPTQSYSLTKGSDVRNLAASMVKAMSARRIKDPKYIGTIANGSYRREQLESGFSDQEIQDWLSGTTNPELDEIRNEVYKQFNSIAPEKLDRFINEGVVIGATYNKKYNDLKIDRQNSNTDSGFGNNTGTINYRQLWDRAFSGGDLKPVDRNLYNSNTASNRNGNFIKNVLPDGTVILKDAAGMLGSLIRTAVIRRDTVGDLQEMSNIIGMMKDRSLADKFARDLDRIKVEYSSVFGNITSQEGLNNINNLAEETLQYVLFKTNDDGTISLDYNKKEDGSVDISNYKNKLKGAAFSDSRSYFKDIINQLESVGINKDMKFNSIRDFMVTATNAYNRSDEFKTHGMTTSFHINLSEDEKNRWLHNIQGNWTKMGDVSFKDNYLNYNTVALDDSEKKAIIKHRKTNPDKVAYNFEFNVVETPDGPRNFYSVYVEDRENNKKYHLVFDPETMDNYQSNDDALLSFSTSVTLKNIYEYGTPEQLAAINSKNRMSFADIQAKIDEYLYQDNLEMAQYWNMMLDEAYKNAFVEGLPQQFMRNIENLQAGWRQKATVIGKHNENIGKAQR